MRGYINSIKFLFFLLLLVIAVDAHSQTLIMNEVSNGPAGNQEYVEFVVYDSAVVYGCSSPTPPCIDIRGWIFDDNSGYHGASGVAAGCVRFSFDPIWACVPVGTIITIFNNADPNTSMPATDISMADGNCRITAPINNPTLFESNTTTPGAVACSYPATGWTPGGNWNFTLLANPGDCARVVNLAGCEVFSVCWGSDNLNTLIYFASGGSGADNVWSFTNNINNSPFNQANWTEGCADPVTCGTNQQTPGAPNNAANAAWIGGMNNNCAPITPLVVDSSFTASSCACNGTATVNASGSIPGYTYVWSPAPGGGQGTPTATGICAGTYTCVVTSHIGCSETLVITVPSSVVLPVISITNPTPTICAGQTANLTGNGGVSYVWNTGANTPTINVNPLVTTTYTVTGTDASGCTNTATATITVNPLPTPTANNTGPYCAGQTIQLNSPTGSATDDWAGPAAYTGINIQNPTIPGATAAAAGVYTVTVTNASGCSATATTTVVINALPTPTANNTGPYCVGGTIQLNSPTGSATDDWAGPAAYISIDVQNPAIPAAAATMAGVYTVTVTNAAGCSATATTTVVINALPTPTANNTGPYCVGQTIQLNSPTGSATDDWAGPSAYTGINIQNPAIPAATAAMAGVYTVTVTNAAGCSATATTTVVINLSATATANNTGPYCVGTNINLTSGAGAVNYDWTGPNAYVQNGTQNPVITGATAAMAGIYTVTVTVAGGCTGTATTTVAINNAPTPLTISNTPVCANGTLLLGANGGVDYDWVGPNAYVQNNTQNPVINNVTIAASGVYTVTVTDANGCSATATATGTVNPLPTIVTNNTGPVCQGSNVNLGANGGVGYAWIGPGGFNDPTQNPVLNNVTPGMGGVYTVTVTDANACTNTGTTNLVVNSNPAINANSNAPVCEGNNINLNATGAVSYAWTGPTGFNSVLANPTIIGITAANNGIYSVTGTDANGCTNTATINISALPLPTVLFSGNPLVGCAPLCVNLTNLSTVTGSTIASWIWTVEGQSTSALPNPSFCFNSPGTYDAALQVTTVDGCTSSLSFNNYITVNGLPVADFIYNPQQITESNPTVNFNNTSVGATNYLWSFGDGVSSSLTNPFHTYADTGTYCVNLLATNASGCSDTVTHCLIIYPDFTVFIPNTFTPNGDDLNQQFMVYGRGISGLDARIFNRWGEEIFHFTDINKGWPGTMQNGSYCQLGVYVYKITVTNFMGDEFNFLGQVNLLR